MTAAGARSAKNKTGYLPSLDGWRTIAILAVISAHDADTHGFGWLTTRRLHQVGWAGVDLFFAISGLLICSRILEEERTTGRISLRGFYIRRFFRISPAAWCFLAAAVILGTAHQIPLSLPATLASFLMVRNYWGVHSGVPASEIETDHFWSLSVEEHFYLLLPSLLVFVRRRILVLSILSAAFFAWLLRFAAVGHLYNNLSACRTDLRVHGLLIPALLAVLVANPRIRALAQRWIQPWFWITVVALGAFAMHNLFLPARIAIVSLTFPFLVLSTMIHPASLVTRLLESPPMRYVGRLSYSMYLWQQIFFLGRAESHAPFTVLQQFPLNYVALMVCAIASYYLVEKPLIALGHRLAPPVTPGRADLTESPAPNPSRVAPNSPTPSPAAL